ncbi:MAG: CDP-diacylglycerol--glycerol-3-phosphate 3-phosphatidyltransferase [Candidatus Woesearchaeota archaeon]
MVKVNKKSKKRVVKSKIPVLKNSDKIMEKEIIDSTIKVISDASIKDESISKKIVSAKTLFNLPNSLTILRMILAPFFMWAILISDYMAALVIIVVASISDFFDGFIARKFNMQTEIGGILDPIADKILIFCSIAALLIKFDFPLWIGVIIISRDMLLLFGGAIFFYNKHYKALVPNMFGKISTFFQMITIIIYILASLRNYYSWWIDMLLYVTVLTTIISGITYVSRIGAVISNTIKKN